MKELMAAVLESQSDVLIFLAGSVALVGQPPSNPHELCGGGWGWLHYSSSHCDPRFSTG